MKVINLLAGPGCRKSTIAAEIFAYMKWESYDVELVTEYVKEAVYTERNIFEDQMYIFAKQQRRQFVMRDKVDWLITDSPLILSAVYSPVNYYSKFEDLCMEAWNSYENINFFLTRENKYIQRGRFQTEDEAKAIDRRIMSYMNKYNIPFRTIPGHTRAAFDIMGALGVL